MPFRVAVMPGIIALWPLLLFGKKFLGEVDRPLSSARIKVWQGVAVLVLAGVIPPITIASLVKRPPQIPADQSTTPPEIRP